MKLKFAERRVTNQFCIEKNFSEGGGGGGISVIFQRTRDIDFKHTSLSRILTGKSRTMLGNSVCSQGKSQFKFFKLT